jgi:uncharacterized UPF0160 family protein
MSKIKLITHNGPFHTDDIFACATLTLVLEKESQDFEVIRTRDEDVIKRGDYVFDVGGVYDESTNRFDHHQAGGAGSRVVRGVEIEYSSFGLIWKKFGAMLCKDEKVAEWMDRKFAVPIDADDNGFSLFDKKYDLSPLLVQDMFSFMRPTWQESSGDEDKNFLKAVATAREILLRGITHGQSRVEAEKLVSEAYKNAEDKRIIILDNYYPLGEVLDALTEPLFVIYPKETRTEWCVKAVGKKGTEFENRKDLPVAWAGLRDEELQKVSGVSDAVFCHRALFMAVARSKEGAVKLAKIAV